MKNDMIFQLFQQKQKNGFFSAKSGKSSNFSNPNLCSSVHIPDKLLQIHDIKVMQYLGYLLQFLYILDLLQC